MTGKLGLVVASMMTMLLVILKAAGVLSLSWFWVTMPLMWVVYVAIIGALGFLAFVVAILIWGLLAVLWE